MARLRQKPAQKGSQKWLQRAVAQAPEILQPPGLPPLRWLSPLETDGFAEYGDAAFLQRLGLERLAPALAAFWPRGGPVWDGLACADDAVVLVEAKGHLHEALSSPCAARDPASRARIAAGLAAARAGLGGDEVSDWMAVFYQFANRLAHLWWLNEQGIEAHLLLVGFTGDDTVRAPTSAEGWRAMHLAMLHALGLPEAHPLHRRVHHLHPDVSVLRDPA